VEACYFEKHTREKIFFDIDEYLEYFETERYGDINSTGYVDELQQFRDGTLNMNNLSIY
jgi:hypothetical protein